MSVNQLLNQRWYGVENMNMVACNAQHGGGIMSCHLVKSLVS